jgi:hypothetical protein
MFERDACAMSRSMLATKLKKVTMLFDVEIGYYTWSASRNSGFSTDVLKD